MPKAPCSASAVRATSFFVAAFFPGCAENAAAFRNKLRTAQIPEDEDVVQKRGKLTVERLEIRNVWMEGCCRIQFREEGEEIMFRVLRFNVSFY